MKNSHISIKENKIKYFLFVLISVVTSGSLFAQPPGVPANNPLYLNGYLDVTLLGADSTGLNVCTKEIQTALKYAYDYDLVCYFPSGTYLVDDTIKCVRKSTWIPKNWRPDDHQYVLVGSSRKRPIIKLKGGSPNFQNAAAPVPVFWIWTMSSFGEQPKCGGTTELIPPSADPLCEQSNVNFNQTFQGIDIDLRPDTYGSNPGACGIRLSGAQGSTIEDVTVYADGAFAGLYNPPGQCGGTYNVTVIGGQYGFYISKVGGDDKSKFQIFSGCTFINQTTKVFRIDSSFPVVMVGFHIVADNIGSINSGLPGDGLSLIDGVVELGSGKFIDKLTSSIYMKNVYVKGVSSITDAWNANPAVWSRVDEYSYCPAGSSNLIEGIQNKLSYQNITENLVVDPAVLANQLIRKHVWEASTFPNFETPGVVNIKDATQMNGNPAKGDGKTDDTNAFLYAIANYDNIFIPKGTYIISKTLTLNKNTKMFGVGRCFSELNHATTWNGVNGNAIIETVDAPGATTTLAFLGINSQKGRWFNGYSTPQHPMEWKAGRNSRVRSISAFLNIYLTGSGGGKWSSFYNIMSQFHVTGTTEPLSLYGFNPERGAQPQAEIIDSKNIDLYYVKSETNTTTNIFPANSYATTLSISNSSNIGIFGGTGNVSLYNQMAMFEFANSKDITLANVRPFKSGTSWYTVKETNETTVTTFPSATRLALYKSLATSPTSVTSLIDNTTTVFPNPCKDFISVNSSGFSQVQNYKITDIQGKLIKEGNLLTNTTQIPLSFEKGMYLLSISSKDKMLHVKLIKE